MKFHRSIARITLACVAVALCGIPEMVQAQSAQPAPAQSQQSSQPEQQTTQTTSGNDQSGTTQNAPEQNKGMVNPSAGPLAPVPSNTQELPNAPSTAQNPAPKLPPPERTPGGAAAAQAGPTAGGPASRPSGNAIAPAKQRQVRSLLIKLGAVAAAGIAIGTVVGLSKGSPSRPPGAK